jgi:hypothetical protein
MTKMQGGCHSSAGAGLMKLYGLKKTFIADKR